MVIKITKTINVLFAKKCTKENVGSVLEERKVVITITIMVITNK
jgi:hypothetical protein